MNITILTSSDYPYGAAPENFVRLMALGLHHNNARVKIVRFWGERRYSKNVTPIADTNYLFNKPFKNELFKFIELLCQIANIPFFIMAQKILFSDTKIILYGMDSSYFVVPFVIYCKLMRIECYRIITEIYPEYTYVTKWWRKPMVHFRRSQIKYFDKYLDGVIVLSKYINNICHSSGVKDHRILLIPNFIDFIARDGDKSGSFRVGYCGTPSLENGIEDLFKSIKILEHKIVNMELLVIGKIDNEIAAVLSKIKFTKTKIVYTGYLNSARVLESLLSCSVLINPRKSGLLADSGFPTKLGEYFSSKVPVVSTKVGDLKSYFSDKEQIVFAEPDNPESLAQSIQYVYENKEASIDIGKKGYDWAMQHLEYKANARKLVDFIGMKS